MLETLSNFETKIEMSQLTLQTLTIDTMSAAYLDWLQDDEIIQFLEIRHSKQSLDTITNFVQSCFESHDNLLMGMFLNETKQHIGNIKLGPVQWRYKRADIGLVIGEKTTWGKGMATEAIAGITTIAFEQVGLHRVQAGAYASNIGSIKAFEKVGFTREGLLKSYWLVDGEPEDEVLLAKVNG